MINFNAIEKETKRKVRCIEESDGRIFVFEKGSSKYGRRWSPILFDEYFERLPQDSEKEKWEKAYKKIIKLLTESNLWPSIKERSKKILECGYDNWKQVIKLEGSKDIYDLYQSKFGVNYFDTSVSEEKRNEYLKIINKEIFGDLIETCPIFFNQKNYSVHLDEYEYGIPRFKTMYFGICNKTVKDAIKNALIEDKDYYSGRTDKWDKTSYDVSFELKAKERKAWYSEEYRGCGNGHYYLALNHSCALFYEHD